jgi:hypothetical protein
MRLSFPGTGFLAPDSASSNGERASLLDLSLKMTRPVDSSANVDVVAVDAEHTSSRRDAIGAR